MINQIKLMDQKIVSFLNDFLINHSNSNVNKFFGEYLIYGLPLLLIILWFWGKNQKMALRALFSVVLAWPILAYSLGHLVHRLRPFDIGGVKELIFHRPTYSFPSDHAAALLAVAASFWFSGNKKLSVAVGIAGLVISFFRVSAGLHFPTDILGGMIVGMVAAYLIYLFDKPLDLIYNFLIKVAQGLKLA